MLFSFAALVSGKRASGEVRGGAFRVLDPFRVIRGRKSPFLVSGSLGFVVSLSADLGIIGVDGGESVPGCGAEPCGRSAAE